MIDKLPLYHIGVIGTDLEAIAENNLSRKTIEQIARQFLAGRMFLVKGKKFTLDTVKEIHFWETEGIEIPSAEQMEAMKEQLLPACKILPPSTIPSDEKSGSEELPREWVAVSRVSREVTTEIFAEVGESQISPNQEEEDASKLATDKHNSSSSRRIAYIVGDGNILLTIDDNGLIIRDSYYNSIVDKVKDQVELEQQQKVLKILEEIKDALKEKDADKAKLRWKKLKDCSSKAADIAMPWISPILKATSSQP